MRGSPSPNRAYILPQRDIDILCYKCGVEQAEFYRELSFGHSHQFGSKDFALLNYYCLSKCGYGFLDMLHFSNEYLTVEEFRDLLYLRDSRPKNNNNGKYYPPISRIFAKAHGLEPTFIATRVDDSRVGYYHKFASYKAYGLKELIPILETNPVRLWRLDKCDKGLEGDNKVVSYKLAGAAFNIHFYRVMRIEAGTLTPSALEVELMSPYISSYGDILEWGKRYQEVLDKSEVDTRAGDKVIGKKAKYLIKRGSSGYSIFREKN